MAAALPLSFSARIPRNLLHFPTSGKTDLVEFILDLGAAADLDDGVDHLRARRAVLFF